MNADEYYKQGCEFVYLEQLDRAAACFEKALEIEPEHAESLNGLGAVEVRRGNSAAALKAFDQSLQINPIV